MKWPASRKLDQALGPRLPHEFDFTLTFEHIILTIVPLLIFILLALWYLWYYNRQHVYIRAGSLKCVKYVSRLCGGYDSFADMGLPPYSQIFLGFLFVIEAVQLRYWCSPAFRTGPAIGAAVVSCVAAATLAIMVNAEHHRSLKSSALTGFYLLISVVFDIVKTRSYVLRAMHVFTGLSAAGAALKFALAGIQEIPQRSEIIDKTLRHNLGRESVTGFWNRAFFVWLNSTFAFGFRNMLTVDDLSELGPEFSSELLSSRLEKTWSKSKKESPNTFLKACLVTFYVDFHYPVLPRLCFSAFTLTQPLYLRRVVAFIGESGIINFIRSGLIASGAIIFLGIALSRALYRHMNDRVATMARGAIIPLIFGNTLVLPYAVVKDSAAATLMSTDIDGVTAAIPQFHDIWASAVEVVLGVYLLATIIKEAAFLVALPIIGSVVLVFYVDAVGGGMDESIQHRVSYTTKVLSQIKSIKMVGLETVASEQVKKLRLDEIAAFKIVRWITLTLSMISVVAYTAAPVLAIAGGLFWTTFQGHVTPVDAFTTLAVAAVIINPLMALLHAYPTFRTITACFGRIQKYLVLAEGGELNRDAINSTTDLEEKTREKIPNGGADESLIVLKEASIAPAAGADTTLRDVSFTIAPSSFTVLIGPVATGKTTVFRAILGEAAIPKGEIWRKQRKFAYCGQRPWLRNITIRENIVAASSFEEKWYQDVIRACCLESDLRQLSGGKGDGSLAGSNGANLSGGQKHRVALARAIYSREPIIVLDDVLSALDVEMAQAIYSRLFGSEGLLRKSSSTVIFATHSVGFLKAADQALVFDGKGAVTVQSNPSEIVLSREFVDLLEKRGDSDDSKDSETADAPAGPDPMQQKDSLKARSRGDLGLYKYFSQVTSTWKLCAWLVSMLILVAVARFPEVFMRIWLENDPTNNNYFIGYALIGTVGCILVAPSIAYYFLRLVPENGIKLHTLLLDAVTGSTLSFLTSTDAGSIINRFSQDMTILTQVLPSSLWQCSYLGIYVIYDIGIIVSGAQYSALLIPFIIGTFYLLQMYYLRTSRQMRLLDIEAKAPLYTLFSEMSIPNGLEHIRAFGWQANYIAEGIQALNYSQKPFYYMFTIQRWLELAMDLIGLFLALILICIATFFRQTTSQAAIGLSMLNLITFGNMFSLAIGAWTKLETALGAIARLRTFVSETPSEPGHQGDGQLATKWPPAGEIEFNNVSAKYQSAGSSNVLENVSLKIAPGTKVGITGRSGSGKSSLLLTLLDLLEHTGTIKIDNVDTNTVPKQQLRSRITTISQDSVQLKGTIRENLIPYEGQADDGKMDDTLLLRTLERVGLSEVIAGNGGLEASLSDMALSEGEMQLFCLARAVLHHRWTEGRVVLMDEPTSNMDHESDARIQVLVRESFAGCTLLMVSHRPESVADADMYLEVSDGKVTCRTVGKEADE